MPHSVLTYVLCIVHWLCNVPGWNKKLLDSTTSQNIGPGWVTAHKTVIDYLLFHFFTTFDPLPHGPKSTRVSKIYISKSKSSLSEVNFSSFFRNNRGHIILYTMAESPVCLTILNNIISSNPSPHIVVPFFSLYIDKRNVKWGRVNWYRQQLRNFNHKVDHKIGCYPKSLLIFITY